MLAQREFCAVPPEIIPGTHAAWQLAQPVQELGINVSDLAAKIFPSDEDRGFACRFLQSCDSPMLALHPGSGSERKNWPIENWIELAKTLLNAKVLFRTIIFVSGEADEKEMARLRTLFKHEPQVRFAHALPLPQLAALLEQSTFIGHDSGISHLAAAAGARCFLLFGPTDPKVWAPQNTNAWVLLAPNGDLTQLDVATVSKRSACKERGNVRAPLKQFFHSERSRGISNFALVYKPLGSLSRAGDSPAAGC